MVTDLAVLMNGIPVGRLSKNRQGGLTFAYDASWLEHPSRRPVSLSLPLVPHPYSGDIVLNFFQNLLPDNDVTLARIQSHLNIPYNHTFDFLATVGKDCIGALQFFPVDVLPPPSTSITGTPLEDEDIARLIENSREMPLGMSFGNDFRISLAGAQEKTALLLQDGRWLRPAGATPTTHILKIPIGILPGLNPIDLSLSCENEWLCLLLARLYGFDAAKAEVRRFSGAKALVVQRFDRRWSDDGRQLFRLPAEDLCQALGVSSLTKYEADGGPGIADIMALLQLSETPDADRETFFRSQVLFWLLQATDGHAKNFSVFLLPGGGFRLTPLYDILSTAPLIASGALSERRVKMAMGLLGKNKHYHFHEIEPRHFLATARATGFPEDQARQVMAKLAEQTPKVIAAARAALPHGFPAEVAESIFAGLTTRSRRLKAFLAV